MAGLSSALNIGSIGLLTNQKCLEVAGNNVANVSTPGYSRQTVTLSSAPTLSINGNLVGQGAIASGIEREQDLFITRQLASKQATLGEAEAQTLPLAEVENVFAVDDNSLASVIDDFFSAWQDLSSAPEGEVERTEVLQAGQALATSLNNMDGELADIRDSLNTSIEGEVADINDNLAAVADLNVQIVAAEARGDTANSLRDQRDLLVQEITGAIGGTSYESSDGTVAILTATGLPLVDGATVGTLVTDRVDGMAQVSLQLGSSETALSMNGIGGTLKGYLTVRDEVIPSLRDELDQLAYQLAESVNAVQNSGYDLDGNIGSDFFRVDTTGAPAATPWTGAAGTITLALTDGSQVAAGTIAPPDNLAGDNTNALAMLGLQDAQVMGGTTSFTDYYSKIATEAGSAVEQNSLAVSGAEDSLEQLQSLRDSTLGVSVEEEMLQLVQFQTAFEASAKYLTAISDMMDSLLAM